MNVWSELKLLSVCVCVCVCVCGCSPLIGVCVCVCVSRQGVYMCVNMFTSLCGYRCMCVGVHIFAMYVCEHVSNVMPVVCLCMYM